MNSQKGKAMGHVITSNTRFISSPNSSANMRERESQSGVCIFSLSGHLKFHCNPFNIPFSFRFFVDSSNCVLETTFMLPLVLHLLSPLSSISRVSTKHFPENHLHIILQNDSPITEMKNELAHV